MATRLITIYFSHYCEKARWALERSGVDFVEEPHAPLLSWAATFGAGAKRTVPALITDDRVLTESTEIVKWADDHGTAERLFLAGNDEVVDLCALFDRKLGPATRRVAYETLLKLPRDQLAELFKRGIPSWEGGLAGALTPLLARAIRRGLRVTPEGALKSHAVIAEIFETVGQRLSDGRKYLAGDVFSAADLTFAALAAPVIAPDAYLKFLPSDRFRGSLDAIITRYRGTRAGEHALKMYELHR